MKTIKNPINRPIRIKLDYIKPFINICPVTGKNEKVNIKIEYVPNEELLEVQSYRDYFQQTFSLHIEEIAETVFYLLIDLLHPAYLHVEIFLVDENLTPWSVSINT